MDVWLKKNSYRYLHPTDNSHQAGDRAMLVRRTLRYDSLWIGDQFYNPLRPNEPMWETWTLLAALAVQTTRIRMGTLVTNFIYRNPALVASQTLTVDHLSSGRLELGLGAGFSPQDHPMTRSEAWESG
jgi:alkanesulfonate monooxygenase SsuD/methylene tetrahydromethanopterin reductase-like flavin-dependent oxidoreductase (luciferase family)